MFVRVVIPIPSDKAFTYAVPERFVPAVAAGMRCIVPFGKRRVAGFVIETMAEAACDQTVKEIIDLPDGEPLFDPKDLPFYQWVSRYYLTPFGKTLAELLPGGIGAKSDRWVSLAEGTAAPDCRLSPGQQRILAGLASFPAGVFLDRLREAVGMTTLSRDLRLLEEAGLVCSEVRLTRPVLGPKTERWVGLCEAPPAAALTAKQRSLSEALQERGAMPVTALRGLIPHASSTLGALVKKGVVRITEQEVCRGYAPPREIGKGRTVEALNEAQAAALDEISRCLASGLFSPCLLHGVTGSGKTEVYLRAIEEALRDGGGAIYLVPEIALTLQLLARIGNRFPGGEVAVLHSGITASVRYDQWKRIRRGEVRLVVGARSALFAPVRNLRLIVVDEEHDASYKQDERLRYNARDLALVRGRFCRATVILGSATPAVQTYHHASEGHYRYLTLPRRIDDRPLPRVEVVDLRTERNEQGLTPLLSRALIGAIGETLAAGKQTLLYLNRRGFHTFLVCAACGHAFSCPNCAISLTHHAAEGAMRCHHCGFTAPVAASCPRCRGCTIHSHGAGTERVEQEVNRLFPAARIARMDSDTTARKGDAERILRGIDRSEVDILVGTQMIAKGHDFPGITLVGVIAADASLNLPDFRAAERTFQVLTQVSGRGGRGDQPGRVLIQTFNPGHYVLRRAQEHDYAGFYADELPLRRQLCYPPFSRLVGFHFSSLDRRAGRRAVDGIGVRARQLAASSGAALDVIGPAESPLARVRGRYRWQLLLRGKESRPLLALAQTLLRESGRTGLEIQADVDPLNFM
ncbi:MAG: replication restart helicase PriA [Syntrophales bacterium]